MTYLRRRRKQYQGEADRNEALNTSRAAPNSHMAQQYAVATRWIMKHRSLTAKQVAEEARVHEASVSMLLNHNRLGRNSANNLRLWIQRNREVFPEANT